MPAQNFTQRLMDWNRKSNHRQMPWKGETDPYRIWLSEIILQQTRVEQGRAYYERFLQAFPTIQKLAEAPEQQVFKCWEGLGYYTRCRNLIATAKTVVQDYHGVFPDSYGDILALKGIGPYTAATIASFAFHLPYVVVDGNVQRVISRYFGIASPAVKAAEKSLYNNLAGDLLDKKDPGTYNQAIMDFGATVCKPQQPLCGSCPQAVDCQAYLHQWTAILPLKAFRTEKKERWFYYFIIETDRNEYFIRERKANDIWKNLYEFVLWDTGKLIPHSQLIQSEFLSEILPGGSFSVQSVSQIYQQTLTHQSIHGCFIHLLLQQPAVTLPGYTAVLKERLRDYAFPRFITTHLNNPVQSLF